MTATTLLQIALLTTTGGEYQKAFERADDHDKPFLVLVGADWCPGCRAMKQEAIPELDRAGDLKGIVYVEVDTDAKPDLSRKLLRGRSIPQLVLYTQAGELWRRVHLAGVHSPGKIRKFLERQISAGREVHRKRLDEQQSNAEESQLTTVEAR
ncbi:MAG: thioredoxin family protein [Planctomycetota bacterium]